MANQVLVPESRVDAVLDEVGVTPPGSDGMTGSWNLDVMLKSGARHIERDIEQILANHGYQSETAGDNYISTGVNWGLHRRTALGHRRPHDGHRHRRRDPAYYLHRLPHHLHVFQISVAGDIRFYGLLKTIGTTPRQLRRIIRLQALALSAAGIPIGLVIGWLIGGQLTR